MAVTPASSRRSVAAMPALSKAKGWRRYALDSPPSAAGQAELLAFASLRENVLSLRGRCSMPGKGTGEARLAGDHRLQLAGNLGGRH